MKNIFCLIGSHTNKLESRYEFKEHINTSYMADEEQYKHMKGYGDIVCSFDTYCKKCDKHLGLQKFSIGFYPELTYAKLPHSEEEAIAKAKSFTHNG